MIPALAGAARSATLEASRVATTTFDAPAPAAAPRWRMRVAVLAAAVALLPVLMAGLAYAGVDLPDVVDEGFDAAGRRPAEPVARRRGAASGSDGQGRPEQGRLGVFEERRGHRGLG